VAGGAGRAGAYADANNLEDTVRYKAYIDFDVPMGVDKNLGDHIDEALHVATSHIIFPRWRGKITCPASGFRAEFAEEGKPLVVREQKWKAGDTIQDVTYPKYTYTLLEFRGFEHGGERWSYTNNFSGTRFDAPSPFNYDCYKLLPKEPASGWKPGDLVQNVPFGHVYRLGSFQSESGLCEYWNSTCLSLKDAQECSGYFFPPNYIKLT
jgi:hypothetical protein